MRAESSTCRFLFLSTLAKTIHVLHYAPALEHMQKVMKQKCRDPANGRRSALTALLVDKPVRLPELVSPWSGGEECTVARDLRQICQRREHCPIRRRERRRNGRCASWNTPPTPPPGRTRGRSSVSGAIAAAITG